MAIRVVDAFEEIDVHHHAGQWEVVAIGASPLAVGLFVEAASSCQTCQRIALGQADQPTFQFQNPSTTTQTGQ